MASGGDLDDDGYFDLVVGAPLAEATSTAADDSGIAYILFHPLVDGGSLEDADYRLHGEDGVLLGTGFDAAGDLDADGSADLAVGAPATGYCTGCSDLGFVYVQYGPLTAGTYAAPDADAILSGPATGRSAGGAVAGVGDANGDGFGDLLIGAPYDGTGGTTGEAFLVWGGDW